MDPNKADVVDIDSNHFNRGVREAMQIRIHQANLNRDGGRHQLPPVYHPLLLPPGEAPEIPSSTADCDVTSVAAQS